jgi:hydrogenase/urease accessory protein HupE
MALASPAFGHDPLPVTVTVAESLPDVFRASLRMPPDVDRSIQPRLRWPGKCQPIQQEVAADARSMRCAGGLEGETLILEYPQYNPSLATFYQLTDRAGLRYTAILAPSQDRWTVPEQPGSGAVARQYLVLGVNHIIGGPDHLLFVFGLLIISGTTRRILWTVTGFTLAHSITLSLSALGIVDVPIAPVEAAIALSILFLALEIGRSKHDTLTYQFPIIVAFLFGLLHGLGFASALGQIGLAPGELVPSLLFFNVGVELGQIAFIVAVIAGISLVRKGAAAVSTASPVWLNARFELLATYVIGIPSAYWLIDRMSFLYR